MEKTCQKRGRLPKGIMEEKPGGKIRKGKSDYVYVGLTRFEGAASFGIQRWGAKAQ